MDTQQREAHDYRNAMLTVRRREEAKEGVTYERDERHPTKREGRVYFRSKWNNVYWKPFSW